MIIVTILSFIGMAISGYIFCKKEQGEILICPIGTTCDEVVNGRFSKTFGIRNEITGFIYYFMIGMINLLAISFEFKIDNRIALAIGVISGGAFIFSIFLVFIQAFIIKKWCSWCLLSAVVSTLIFLFSIKGLLVF